MFAKFSTFFSSIPINATLVWVYLLLAAAFEIIWALSLKLTNGYTHPGWTLATIPLALISTGLLALAMKGIPMGTAYAVWTGAGAIGTVLIGIAFFNEAADLTRIFCICLILFGLIGLKLTQSN